MCIVIQCGNFGSKIFLEFLMSANQEKKKKLKSCSLFLELVFEHFLGCRKTRWMSRSVEHIFSLDSGW
jgi:hypothetical protein